MESLIKAGFNYLLKGGLIAGASNLFMNQIRKKVKSGLTFAILQVLFFGALLFLIDYVLPKILPNITGKGEDSTANKLVKGFTNLLSGKKDEKK